MKDYVNDYLQLATYLKKIYDSKGLSGSLAKGMRMYGLKYYNMVAHYAIKLGHIKQEVGWYEWANGEPSYQVAKRIFDAAFDSAKKQTREKKHELLPELKESVELGPGLRRLTKSGEEFNRFWNLYPRKVGKDAALKAWNRKKNKPDIETILQGLRDHINSDQWIKQDGIYIPHPTTYINQGRWFDVILPNQQTSVKQDINKGLSQMTIFSKAHKEELLRDKDMALDWIYDELALRYSNLNKHIDIYNKSIIDIREDVNNIKEEMRCMNGNIDINRELFYRLNSKLYRKKRSIFPKLRLPKIRLPKLKIRSPFVLRNPIIHIDGNTEYRILK